MRYLRFLLIGCLSGFLLFSYACSSPEEDDCVSGEECKEEPKADSCPKGRCDSGGDEKELPTLAFASASQTIEGYVGEVELGLRLSAAAKQEVSVEYEVGGSAKLGRDHELEPGTLVFAPGKKELSLSFDVAFAEGHEELETLVLTLKSPRNAQLGKPKVHTVYFSAAEDLRPEPGKVSINGGREFSKEPVVELTLEHPALEGSKELVQLSLSCDATTWAPPRDLSAAENVFDFDLRSSEAGCVDEDGEKVVHARFGAPKLWSNPTQASIVLDREPPVFDSFKIEGGARWVAKTLLSLNLSASDSLSGLDGMRFSCDGNTWGDAQSYAANAAFDLEDESAGCGPQLGERRVFAQLSDRAGNLSEVLEAQVTLLSEQVEGALLLINAGAAFTKESELLLSLFVEEQGSAGDLVFRLSCDQSRWSKAAPYTSELPFDLNNPQLGCSGEDGLKTVFASVRRGADAEWSDPPAQASIVLDTKAPENLTLNIEGGQTFTRNSVLELKLEGEDQGSGIAGTELSCDGHSWKYSEGFVSDVNFDLADSGAGCSLAQGEKSVHFRLHDHAGNVSESVSGSIVYDSLPPESTSIHILQAPATSKDTLNLELLAQDSGSGVASMVLSCNGELWTEALDYQTELVWELEANSSVGCSAEDGEKIIYARFIDHAGNLSQVVHATAILDTKAPVLEQVMLAGGSAYSNREVLSVKLLASDTGSGLASYSLSCNGEDWSAAQPFAEVFDFDLGGGEGGCFSKEGTRQLFARVADAAGNLSEELGAEIFIDTIPPSHPELSINWGAAITNNPKLVLLLGAQDSGSGLSHLEVSCDGELWSEAFSMSQELEWDLGEHSELGCSAENGLKKLWVRYFDRAKNVSETVESSIELDTSAPDLFTLSINQGKHFTKSSELDLRLQPASKLDLLQGVQWSCNGLEWTQAEPVVESRPANLNWPEVGCALNEGEHQIWARVQNLAGTWSEAFSARITYDVTAPSTSLSLSSGSPKVQDWYSDAVEVRFEVDDSGSGPGQTFHCLGAGCEPDSELSTVVLSGLDRFDYRLRFYSVDKAGNAEAVQEEQILVDVHPPSPGSLNLASGESRYKSTSTFNLGWSAEDAESGVDSLRFSCDQQQWGNVLAYDSQPATIDVRASALGCPEAEGERTLWVQFSDQVGNWSEAVSLSLVFDQSPPSTSASVLEGSLGDEGWYRSTVVLELGAGDEGGSGLEWTRSCVVPAGSEACTPDFEGNLVSIDELQGDLLLYFYSQDRAQNREELRSFALKRDSDAPLLSQLQAPNFVAGTLLELEATVSDALSGVVAGQYSCDGEDWSEEQPLGDVLFEVNAVLDVDLALASAGCVAKEGENTLFARFRDLAGNWSPPQMTTTFLDTTPPELTGIELVNQTQYLGSTAALLSIDASDSGSGLHSVSARCLPAGDWLEWQALDLQSMEHSFPLAACDIQMGEKSIELRLRDAVGNVSASEGLSFTHLPEVPEIHFVGLDEPLRNHLNFELELSVSQEEYLDAMHFSCNGEVWGQVQPFHSSPSLDLSGLPELGCAEHGQKELLVQVQNLAGVWSEPAGANFAYDNSPPEIVSISFKDFSEGDYKNHLQVELELLANDEVDGWGSGVAGWMLSCDGESWSEAAGQAAASLPLNLASSSLLGCSSEEGRKDILIKVRDQVGNESPSHSTFFFYDITPPDSALTVSGKEGRNGWFLDVDRHPVMFSISASDDSGEDVRIFACFKSQEEPAPCSFSLWGSNEAQKQAPVSMRYPQATSFELIWQAEDAAGNRGAVQSAGPYSLTAEGDGGYGRFWVPEQWFRGGGASTVSELSAGSDKTCFVAGGSVACVGRALHTGDPGEGQISWVPTEAFPGRGDLGFYDVALVEAGANAICVAYSDKRAPTCRGIWGFTEAQGFSHSYEDEHTTALALGEKHLCRIYGGGVQCRGPSTAAPNYYGFGGIPGDSHEWVDVPGLESGVSRIAAGSEHSCAIRAGVLYCWGKNNHGQLGNGTQSSSLEPVAVTSLGSGVVEVSAGTSHTCALKSDNTAYCWGSNSHGQLAIAPNPRGSVYPSRDVPTQVNTAAQISALGAGDLHSCFITSGGAGIACAGSNSHGQLGNRSTEDSSDLVAVWRDPRWLGSFSRLRVGANHNCVTRSGGIYCWGDNSWSQLGLGYDTESKDRMTGTVANLTPPPEVQNLSFVVEHSGVDRLFFSAAAEDNILEERRAPLTGKSDCGSYGPWTQIPLGEIERETPFTLSRDAERSCIELRFRTYDQRGIFSEVTQTLRQDRVFARRIFSRTTNNTWEVDIEPGLFIIEAWGGGGAARELGGAGGGAGGYARTHFLADQPDFENVFFIQTAGLVRGAADNRWDGRSSRVSLADMDARPFNPVPLAIAHGGTAPTAAQPHIPGLGGGGEVAEIIFDGEDGTPNGPPALPGDIGQGRLAGKGGTGQSASTLSGGAGGVFMVQW